MDMMYLMTNEKYVNLELIVPGFNLSNNARMVKGSLTLNDIEKKAFFGEFSFDRGMSIRNLNKTLSELSNGNVQISFNLITKSEKLIKDLEESEINFRNIAGQSCYQSATLQGFIHVIFPLSIKNLNKEREKNGQEKVESLDELRNYNIFNNTVIDTIKEILYIQGCGNGGIYKDGTKRYQAKKLFEVAPPLLLGGPQDINNTIDINKDTNNLANHTKDLPNHVDNFFKSIQAPPKKNHIVLSQVF